MSDDGDGRAAPDPQIINEDLPCDGCGYNLRGLTDGHRCPECGAPVAAWPEGQEEIETSETFRKVAGEAGVPEPAVWFVFDAINFTLERGRIAAGGRPGHVDAEAVKWGIRDYALEYFGTPQEARGRLQRISLRRSEDVGRLVTGLVAGGVFQASPTDRLEDFDGLFTFETLFSVPRN